MDTEHPADHPRIPVYRIHLEGQVGAAWFHRFDDLELSHDAHGDTWLTGPVVDQAMLQGLFKTFRDAGIAVVSVNPIHTFEEE